MNIGEARIGLMVVKAGSALGPSNDITDVGFITGLEYNPTGEVIVRVSWASGSSNAVHPSLLRVVYSSIKSIYKQEGSLVLSTR